MSAPPNTLLPVSPLGEKCAQTICWQRLDHFHVSTIAPTNAVFRAHFLPALAAARGDSQEGAALFAHSEGRLIIHPMTAEWMEWENVPSLSAPRSDVWVL
jgi:hypothetical protein